METRLIIDGAPVRFKKTGGTAIRYLERTGRELNSDLAKFFEALSGLSKVEDKLQSGLVLMRMETGWMYDFLYFFNVIYSTAERYITILPLCLQEP